MVDKREVRRQEVVIQILTGWTRIVVIGDTGSGHLRGTIRQADRKERDQGVQRVGADDVWSASSAIDTIGVIQ